jgi:hypothetical protein
VLDCPVERRGERIVVAVDPDRLLHELRLTTVAMRRHHHAAGHCVRDLGTMVHADDVQAQIDARRSAG